ncbi:hypothetical protein FGB62_51g119 [Gracilaria domingensis]|nr:hypothetical protein FGB62_51g119 [Gracilaria domingensis]
MEPIKRSGSIRLPCGRTQLIIGGISSVLGPLLDNYHSQFQVLRYEHPIELDFGLFGAHLHVTTAWFTSPLFVIAGLIITNGVAWLDSLFGRSDRAERMTIPKALATVCMFCSIYYLSGAISQTEVKQYALWILTAMGLMEWYFMDGSVAGMMMGALTAVCGPLIEVGLINIGNLYSYKEWDVVGIPWMIVAVYFAGGPAVGNLARAVDAAVCDKSERIS